MKRLIIFLLPVLLALNAGATAQHPDKIIYDGQTYGLSCNPLEAFFEKYSAKRPVSDVVSSACWRGYVATFEIKDDQLFVKDIEIQVSVDNGTSSRDYTLKSVMNEVFPGQTYVKVDWLTGLLVLPFGKQVEYVHMGYASVYEKYILLEINKGDFKRALKFNSEEYVAYRERQFQAFKKTDKYKEMMVELTKDGSSPDFIDSFLKEFETDYTMIILE